MWLSTTSLAHKEHVTSQTIRRWIESGKYEKYERIKTGHYRVWVDNEPTTYAYARVSSAKQKDDLQRQVTYMQERFPEASIIKDIGSGLNFKRKGLKAILERAMQGDKLKLVVAHRDRLARFGYDLIKQIIERTGGEVLVLSQTSLSPEQELTNDLLNILHVFSCRMHGIRNYKNEVNKALSNERAKKNA